MTAISIQTLNIIHIELMLPLLKELNQNIEINLLEKRAKSIFEYPNYKCFGMFDKDKLIGICGIWTMERFYSGKQLEIDNFIISADYRSQKLGEKFLFFIEDIAQQNNCLNIELNAYKENTAAHNFYKKHSYLHKGNHYLKVL